MNGGITFGGDTIISATYTNGTTTKVSAGETFQFGFGGLYQFRAVPLALMLSYNYQSDYAAGANGELYFRRKPIEALAYFTGFGHFRFGGGVRIVNAARAAITVNGQTESLTFDNARGRVAEIGYEVTRGGWVNVRYVKEEYQPNTFTFADGTTISATGSTPYNGSHYGVNLTVEF